MSMADEVGLEGQVILYGGGRRSRETAAAPRFRDIHLTPAGTGGLAPGWVRHAAHLGRLLHSRERLSRANVEMLL